MMDASTLQGALEGVVTRILAVYVLAAIVGLIAQYLIVRLAVKHGAIDALVATGLTSGPPATPLEDSSPTDDEAGVDFFERA